MRRPKKDRTPKTLSLQEFGKYLLYENVETAILYVLKRRQHVGKDKLARAVLTDFFRVKGLRGAAFDAFEQVVLEKAGHLTSKSILRTASGNYILNKP
ncbi:MAG TPA: hypothetical protein EYQ24_16720 [Bacteroidetes bacterium]|nr:hypothetical protein [Bacteroidota bacterium]